MDSSRRLDMYIGSPSQQLTPLGTSNTLFIPKKSSRSLSSMHPSLSLHVSYSVRTEDERRNLVVTKDPVPETREYKRPPVTDKKIQHTTMTSTTSSWVEQVFIAHTFVLILIQGKWFGESALTSEYFYRDVFFYYFQTLTILSTWSLLWGLK